MSAAGVIAPDGEVDVDGVRFRYLAWGPDDGPLALLVHGFPDTALTWRHLGPALAEHGYRVIAPWTRGYAPTAVPADGDYTPQRLAADVNGLHEALGGDANAVVVGHDWGALAAYRAAAAAPERWRRVVTMAIPPEPALLAGGLDLGQLFGRSWYTILFQVPGAERLVAAPDQGLVELLWRRWSPGYLRTPEEAAATSATFRAPGSARAAVSYYRGARQAAVRRTFPDEGAVPAQPTLYLHGRDDGCLGVALADPAQDLLGERSEVVLLDAVGHFLHLERPDEVARRVVAFLGDAATITRR